MGQRAHLNTSGNAVKLVLNGLMSATLIFTISVVLTFQCQLRILSA